MTRWLLLLILLAATGCSNSEPPVPEADREAFRLALAASRADMAVLKACRDAGKLSAVEAREVEIRQAELSFLHRDAARHRLGPDVEQVERGQPTSSARCDGPIDRRFASFSRNALATLRAIEKVEGQVSQ